MAKYKVKIDSTSINVEASNKHDAELKAARAYVRRYPKANLDTRKVLSQYKIKVRKV